MKLNILKRETTSFVNIPEGHFFRVKNFVFMKIPPLTTNSGDDTVNAIEFNPHKGLITVFNQNEQVQKLDQDCVELTIRDA